jgi:hypothetical protein
MTTKVHHAERPGPDPTVQAISPLRSSSGSGAVQFRWWMTGLPVVAISTGLFLYSAMSDTGAGFYDVGSAGWWVVTAALHMPFVMILLFLIGGLVERIGFYWKGRTPEPAGRGGIPTVRR